MAVNAPDNHCGHCGHHHELQVNRLSVSYRTVPALEDITFGTSCGNAVALIGPNGAGKSTLLKAIAGLVPRTRGTILWRGTPVSRWHREFAYLPQREEVDWSFPVTVRGLVEMGRYSQLGWWRKWRPVDTAMVDDAMSLMKVDDLAHRQISELSGGQQQRSFLARAIAQEAHVLLLDEPFTGLDRPAQETFSSLVRKLASEGRLVISSHHDLATVRNLYDEVLLLNRRATGFGRTAEAFRPDAIEELYSRPPSGGPEMAFPAPLAPLPMPEAAKPV